MQVGDAWVKSGRTQSVSGHCTRVCVPVIKAGVDQRELGTCTDL